MREHIKDSEESRGSKREDLWERFMDQLEDERADRAREEENKVFALMGLKEKKKSKYDLG